MRALFAALFVLLSGSVSMAAAPAAPVTESIPREQFKTQFEKRMIEGFCKETKFVSHCYDVDEKSCEREIRSSLGKCMASSSLPKEIEAKSRTQIGTKIGRCVGEDFQKKNKSRLRQIPECQNAVEWLGK